MKIGSLVAGIILLIIAVIGFTSTSNMIAEKQTTGGQIERFFSNDAQTNYQANQYAQLGFGGLGVLGLGLVIYGAAAKGESRRESEAQEFYCKYCGFVLESLDGIRAHVQYHHKKSTTDSKKQDDVKNLGILKERLAKGEITKEEYDELKKEFE